jgi:uncharacterized protein (DUF885 family)
VRVKDMLVVMLEGRDKVNRFRMMNKLVIVVAMLGLICSRVPGAEMDVKFDELGERYLEALLKASPVNATGLGDHRYDHLLDEMDREAWEGQLESAREFLRAMEAIEVGSLSRERQVDFHLLRHELEKDVWEIEVFRDWEWNPLIYSAVAGDAIYGLLARESDEVEARLEAAGARLRAFPRYFEQAREVLIPERVPLVYAETAVEQNRGLTALLDGVLGPHLSELPVLERIRLEEAVEVAREAIGRQQDWLESELLPQAKGEARLGADMYAARFEQVLFTSMAPEALRARAEAGVADLHERMYAIAKEIEAARNPGVEFPEAPSAEEKRELIRACLELAAEDRPEKDGVVAAAEHSMEITTAFVREKDLISIPDDPLKIIVMPEFRRGVSLAYCDAPGPLDVGEETFYAVAPPPADWSEEQVDSILREYNRRSLHVLTIHEAMPGHFVQLALANRYPSRLRSVLASGSFIEGWAVYCEWMLVEEGFLEEDLLMKLVVLKWYLRDRTNALLDQMVHVDGISEEEGVRFLVEQAFQEESEAVKKFRRAQLTSGQLATYFAGYLEQVDLRAAAEERLGEDFDLKAYHDGVLSYGSPPVRYVRALLLDEAIPE